MDKLPKAVAGTSEILEGKKVGSIDGVSKGHAILLPYPSQGHINPFLQFGKRLVTYGVRTTLAITRFIARATPLPPSSSMSVGLEEISDGHDASGFPQAESIESYLLHLKNSGSKTLEEAIERQKAQGFPVHCVIYDPFLPWALDVAKKHGLAAVAFFTQPCTVDAIYYHAYMGSLPEPLSGPTISVDGVPQVLDLKDLPSFIAEAGPYPAYLAMLLDQFSNLEEADAVLFNTIYKLEVEATDWLAKICPAKTIGPTLPSAYLDKRVVGDEQYGFDLFPRKNCPCKKWLDSKESGSVVYVSFGSLVKLSSEQMEEIADGLKSCTKCFLWVVRDSERCNLPDKFIEETKEVGLVVGWSPQLEVLAHPAVGCFVTHCGWNSTLEAMCLGVPMVAIPQWSDQPTNAKLVEDAWGVGIRAKVDEQGMVTKEETESCIRGVMDGDRGEDIKKNSAKWKDVAVEALRGGGSSDVSTQELVDIISNYKSD